MSTQSKIIYWKIDEAVQKEAVENYRTNFALTLKDKSALEIIRELTFDGVAPSIAIEEIEKLFSLVEKRFLKKKIAGFGIEVGAGPLVFSSILSQRKEVTKMYGIEICAPIIEYLYPKFANEKTVGVVGSFDNMELPDQSVDFILDFFSLHHSHDINVTLRECRRVLKPGGLALCFDKARPDSLNKEDLEDLLDVTYPESYNAHFGLPLDHTMTRRKNGEREYRLKDWKTAFLKAGFTKFEYAFLAKTTSRNQLIRFVKESFLQFFLPSTKLRRFSLEPKNRYYTSVINNFPKEVSLMIAYV